MTTILIAFFGVIATVNFTMARYASATFGGIVVENSYVASQRFNGWLDTARAQDALGWRMKSGRVADGKIAVAVEGPSATARLAAVARHPLGRRPDRVLTFVPDGQRRFRSGEALPAGRWIVRFVVTDGAQRWQVEERFQ